MAVPFVRYHPGTIQVTNGTKDVVGTGTNFTVLDQFDKIWVDGYPVVVDTITDDTHFTAIFNYLGTSGSGKAYEWIPTGDLSRALALSTQLTAYFSSGNLAAEAALVGLTDQVSYYTGAGAKALAPFDANARDLLTRWTRATAIGPASLDLHEDTDNGVDRIRLSAPALLSANRSFILPDADVTMSAFIATLLGAPAAPAAISALGIPVGAWFDFGGTALPAGFLWAYGQNASRSAQAPLFAAYGTTYGAGDGTTTFGLPDLRGRVVAGKDDMGGSSANRLTGLSGGLNGDTLGASGGAETHTLTSAQQAAMDFSTVIYNGGAAYNPGSRLTSAGAVTFATNDGVGYSTLVLPTSVTGSGGGGGAHNNVQPTFVSNKIIFAGV